ncbi:MAG: bifunctional DNA-formamidopyrimidine glycosylase/DNA-(apurinic or apyrimidinic site) lyase [Thiotrichaceae bacterium]|nr:bifunctional DNA-formamidopyrimidine glycosylase/DNA-(apurinic or apyrimidinic site) lyase [Thiotrichaceae bacterium]PCI14812.1 MAG: DNA-formamidopyrimidine glycosylase [Thiotrichales bacterium]
MPELPEVETTRAGIEPHLRGQCVTEVRVYQRQLRQPVTMGLATALKNKEICSVERRGKYLLLKSASGTVIIHLGMSGSLRLVDKEVALEKHDHVEFLMASGQSLRYRDPRRFGLVLWTAKDPLQHPLLAKLGLEPLDDEFDVDYLYKIAQQRRVAIKSFIMNGQIVVGVGNIYASEALFRAGIHPTRAAKRISRARCERLVGAIKSVLAEAIKQGGTTLRDFYNGAGEPGYFKQRLQVYGRGGEACVRCGSAIRQIVQGQRSTWYCGRCQR